MSREISPQAEAAMNKAIDSAKDAIELIGAVAVLMISKGMDPAKAFELSGAGMLDLYKIGIRAGYRLAAIDAEEARRG